MDPSLKLIIVALASFACAAPSVSTTVASSPASDYSTVSFNFSAAQTYLPNDDYSNERLAFLWDQVGPIETAAVTTVVEPTPEPSPFPQPNWVHPLVPSYNNEIDDAKLPDGFLWGVASAGECIATANDYEASLTPWQPFRSKEGRTQMEKGHLFGT
jgi:hypothetical protein